MREAAAATPEELRRSPVFADAPDDQLRWLCQAGRALQLDPRETLAEQGAVAREMFVMLSGALQLVVHTGGTPVPVDVFRTGAVSGVLPYSRMQMFGGELVALEPSRVFALDRDYFPELLQRMPGVGPRLVAIMSDRVRDQARDQQQREKMLALGKLSAGLAHELNNPAAAARRAAAALRDRIGRMPGLALRVVQREVRFQELADAEAARQAAGRQEDRALSTLARAAREDRVAAWLEAHRVPDAHLLAPTLSENGLTPDRLEQIAASVRPEALPDVLAWIENSAAAHRLLDEILASTARISELVGSIKTYSHMDRAPHPQPTEIPPGLESTLVMLGGRLRAKNIRVEREFAPDLPPVLGMPGELNQVWTNLIDNALHALPPGGRLRLAARPDLGGVLVEVEDNGPGIPPEILGRIFEPFFTTKPVGEGTGLGLDIVHRIVTKQHRGSIRVASEPGKTVFSVWLPASPAGDASLR
jgi:signal transduction histidine kinase